MSRLITNPDTFAAAAIKGFVEAHPRHVIAIEGGVMRLSPIPDGQVGLVVGGGSGHYPAFAGLVGAGLAAGAACGNIFASPSAGQVHRVGQAVERGGGLLLAFGNYAGDVLHFTQGAERLRADGFDVRIVTVTDDIASAGPDHKEQRRGIAGGLAIYKVAGAAAEAGQNLDAVERIAQRANGRTRSLGVAFSGCTLPGADKPLFTVPAGRMALGMGLHGEPGLSEGPITDAQQLAQMLVEQLLDDLPEGVNPQNERVVVLLNGLGGFKYEELFSLFGAVTDRLKAKGVVVADCECGELVTSLDMAGVSLTLFWVDSELESLWNAPADSPAYRRGLMQLPGPSSPPISNHPNANHPNASHPTADHPPTPRHQASTQSVAKASAQSAEEQAVAASVLQSLKILQREFAARENELGQLDAIAGDGDHGLGMARGVNGAVEAAHRIASAGGDVKHLLLVAGEAWSDCGGGTSGALWGAGLRAAGMDLKSSTPTPGDWIGAVGAAAEALQQLGNAVPGDKTMVDALVPFHQGLVRGWQAGDGVAQTVEAAALASQEAALATASLLPRLGRARPHAEKSLGHPDPGAMSFAYGVMAFANGLKAVSEERTADSEG
jgi:D-erythrulose 4-kinase|uniref:dihydroxyacetone kinase family protein n=1 Tax=Cyanobium sp. TaxID=2164130 RepID=UPI00404A189E